MDSNKETQCFNPRKLKTKSFRLGNLNSRDSDFKAGPDGIEKYLNSNEVSKERLRLALIILKNFLQKEKENSQPVKDLVEEHFCLIERHYDKLYEDFEEMNMGFKPLIKLLQIFELMLENLGDEGLKKEVIERFYRYLRRKNLLANKDWRFLRKLCEHFKSQNIENLENSLTWRSELLDGFQKNLSKTKGYLLWKNETEAVKLAKEMIEAISILDEETLFKSLLMGRFDKETVDRFLKAKTGKETGFSMVLGDEGGLFLLINSVPPGSRLEKCILESGMSQEFLNKKRRANKVILGKGSFGKVRLALSVFGSLTVDIGQIVCVKKSFKSTSTLEDFFARKLNDSIHAPKPLDMAILNRSLNDKRHAKGYIMMELVPEYTGDVIFREKRFQKWEYQKPYILAVMKTTNDLLVKDRVFNTDLKPQNTLFEPLSRKMAIIDLGSSVLVNNDQNIEEFDVTSGGFGISEPYCPPEIIEYSNLERLNLKKAISYLCGITLAEVTCTVPTDRLAKLNFKNWILTAENTDLDKESKNDLITTLKGLTEKNPVLRLDLTNAIAKVEKIGLEANEIMKKASSQHYIEKVKKLIRENPSDLNLNVDINETRREGIIQQMLVRRNPNRLKHQSTRKMNKVLEHFMKKDDKVLVLLGEAGSGKSLALQLQFIKEIEAWEYGKNALPFFFNMADEVDLEKVFNHLNATLGCNIALDDPNNDEIHLFIDSYDEAFSGGKKRSTEEKPTTNEKHTEKSEERPGPKIIEEYFKKLINWKRSKIVIGCRTDFVQREGDDDLSEFMVPSMNKPTVRYIVSVMYGMDDSITRLKHEIEVQARQWLNRKDITDDDNTQVILKRIKRLGVEERMRTGMMFNMIMKMVMSMGNENLSDLRIKGFEIYRWTIREEFRENWRKFVFGQESSKISSGELEASRKRTEEIKKRVKVNYKQKLKDDDPEMIWEEMERIGELLATEMSLKKSNRVSYSEVERLLGKEKRRNEFSLDERTEWKTLYQILRIMGLKLERRKGLLTVEAGGTEGKNRNLYENEETIEIGFRLETYKNYYLVRSLKRLMPVVMMMSGKALGEKSQLMKEEDSGAEAEASGIVRVLLEEEGVISNYELLRFCGEDILNYKDPSLREGLRKLLYLEQEKNRREGMQKKTSAGAFWAWLPKVQGPFKKRKISRAAVIISLLVAGSYGFFEEDLSDLDLAGANMRGGDFFGSKFERTDLREANLRNADLSEARFVEADLRGLQLGVWPDLIGHNDTVYSVCSSPDGKRFATGSSDHSVKFWDSMTGECMQTLLGHSGIVWSVCFSHDGERVASSSSDNSVKIWDALSGECVKTLLGHSKQVNSVCFSPDGKRLASGSHDNSVKIWDALSGKCEQTFLEHKSDVWAVSFSPDGKIVASGSNDHSTKIWDAWSGRCLLTLLGPSMVRSVCFSPDGKRVASACFRDSVKIWDTLSGECMLSIPAYIHSVVWACFSPGGKTLATCGNDDSVKIWDALSGECLQTLMGHHGGIWSVCFSPDGKRIASSSSFLEKLVKIWDVLSGETVQPLSGHNALVWSVRFSPEGNRVVSCSDDHSVKIWDASSGECLQTLLGHNQGGVLSVCFSPCGKIVASSGGYGDSSVRIWDLLTGECRKILSGHNGRVWSVCFSPDGKKVVSGADDNTVKIWDVLSGVCRLTLFGHVCLIRYGGVNSVCFSPDGKKVASGGYGDRSVKIWDAFSGDCLHSLLGHNQGVLSVCFSPNRVVASGSSDNSVKIWDELRGECLLTLLGHTSVVYSVCFSPDGKRLASGSRDSSVKVWDLLTGECLQTQLGYSGEVFSVCFSPDGRRIASGSVDHSVKIMEALSGEGLEMNKGIGCVSEFFKGGKKEETKFKYRKIFKPGFEKTVNFESCVFMNCLIENECTEKVILQRKGKILK